MEVIAVGTAAIDVVHEVAAYPEEDTKARSLATWKCRGGNAASALVVCSQLGGCCRWLSTSTDPAKDSDAAFIHADLASFNVDCSLAVIETEGSMPVSYILSSRATGSRTIVHSRTIAELSVEAFKTQVERYLTEVQRDVNASVWFHFEGRNMEAVRQMMLHLRERAPHANISVEIEFPRYPWTLAKTLASLADYVFMSKDYLRDNINILSAQEFFERIRSQQWDEDWNRWVKAFICPWGSEGVYYLEMSGATVHHIPAAQLDQVVESNGAGDSFIGCSQHGFKLPVDRILKWRQDLQTVNGSEQDDINQDRGSWMSDAEHWSKTVMETLWCLENRLGREGNQVIELTCLIKLPMKPIQPRMRISEGQTPPFVLEARTCTTWDTAGTQLWRAALLLAEYINSSPELFGGQTVLELGCGIGFTSLVASRMSRCVYSTDCDENALQLAMRNAKRNHHGDLRFRLLDWGDSTTIPTSGDTSTLCGWTLNDKAELEKLTSIIASDVFYDDATTILFLRALRRLMMQYCRAKAC
ncbi:uncharacterized protein IUM83_13777 [Phytophthora cinnamomi]|uniref:uncharacterized protein n=1 Tax=Phytophthora cinnamomi TaxID=4785 RepID=UPI00355A397C|nr:hypothetical protein IUM83_13777 [Phytophthora cinnamomi]